MPSHWELDETHPADSIQFYLKRQFVTTLSQDTQEETQSSTLSQPLETAARRNSPLSGRRRVGVVVPERLEDGRGQGKNPRPTNQPTSQEHVAWKVAGEAVWCGAASPSLPFPSGSHTQGRHASTRMNPPVPLRPNDTFNGNLNGIARGLIL